MERFETGENQQHFKQDQLKTFEYADRLVELFGDRPLVKFQLHERKLLKTRLRLDKLI